MIALLIGAYIGAGKLRTANTTVEVIPVSTLNWGYMENTMSIDGIVYDQDSQNIYPDATQIISEVFVKEGQQVKKGDKLLAYDMASQNLTLQIRKVAVEKSQNNLDKAWAELNALYNTKAYPDGYDPVVMHLTFRTIRQMKMIIKLRKKRNRRNQNIKKSRMLGTIWMPAI